MEIVHGLKNINICNFSNLFGNDGVFCFTLMKERESQKMAEIVQYT